MGVLRFIRAHVDSLMAIALTLVFLLEVYLEDEPATGTSFLARIEPDETVALAACMAFLLSLAARVQLPLLPLLLAFVAVPLLGRGALDAFTSLALGLALTSYSVGAWSSGRAGQVGALGVGALIGLSVLRAGGSPAEVRDIAGPVFVLLGSWLLGSLVRGVRVARGDPRTAAGWRWGRGLAAPDSAGRDDTVRELRDVIERAMSVVILRSRDARRSLESDPRAAHKALTTVEAAASDALDETQRLTGLLLSPHGTPSPEPQPGLADLDYLAEEVTRAGLPVDMRVEGRPLPLTPDLDAVAYLVVHEALMSTLESATDAHASVVIRYEPDELQVEVTDDGVPAGDDDVEETAGLVAARKEVAALGGTLDAGPGEGRGYWVLARLPYEADWN